MNVDPEQLRQQFPNEFKHRKQEDRVATAQNSTFNTTTPPDLLVAVYKFALWLNEYTSDWVVPLGISLVCALCALFGFWIFARRAGPDGMAAALGGPAMKEVMRVKGVAMARGQQYKERHVESGIQDNSFFLARGDQVPAAIRMSRRFASNEDDDDEGVPDQGNEPEANLALFVGASCDASVAVGRHSVAAAGATVEKWTPMANGVHGDLKRLEACFAPIDYHCTQFSSHGELTPTSVNLATVLKQLQLADRQWQSVVIYVAGHARLVPLVPWPSDLKTPEGNRALREMQTGSGSGRDGAILELCVDSSRPLESASWVDLVTFLSRIRQCVSSKQPPTIMFDIVLDKIGSGDISVVKSASPSEVATAKAKAVFDNQIPVPDDELALIIEEAIPEALRRSFAILAARRRTTDFSMAASETDMGENSKADVASKCALSRRKGAASELVAMLSGGIRSAGGGSGMAGLGGKNPQLMAKMMRQAKEAECDDPLSMTVVGGAGVPEDSCTKRSVECSVYHCGVLTGETIYYHGLWRQQKTVAIGKRNVPLPGLSYFAPSVLPPVLHMNVSTGPRGSVPPRMDLWSAVVRRGIKHLSPALSPVSQEDGSVRVVLVRPDSLSQCGVTETLRSVVWDSAGLRGYEDGTLYVDCARVSASAISADDDDQGIATERWWLALLHQIVEQAVGQTRSFPTLADAIDAFIGIYSRLGTLLVLDNLFPTGPTDMETESEAQRRLESYAPFFGRLCRVKKETGCGPLTLVIGQTTSPQCRNGPPGDSWISCRRLADSSDPAQLQGAGVDRPEDTDTSIPDDSIAVVTLPPARWFDVAGYCLLNTGNQPAGISPNVASAAEQAIVSPAREEEPESDDSPGGNKIGLAARLKDWRVISLAARSSVGRQWLISGQQEDGIAVALNICEGTRSQAEVADDDSNDAVEQDSIAGGGRGLSTAERCVIGRIARAQKQLRIVHVPHAVAVIEEERVQQRLLRALLSLTRQGLVEVYLAGRTTVALRVNSILLAAVGNVLDEADVSDDLFAAYAARFPSHFASANTLASAAASGRIPGGIANDGLFFPYAPLLLPESSWDAAASAAAQTELLASCGADVDSEAIGLSAVAGSHGGTDFAAAGISSLAVLEYCCSRGSPQICADAVAVRLRDCMSLDSEDAGSTPPKGVSGCEKTSQRLDLQKISPTHAALIIVHRATASAVGLISDPLCLATKSPHRQGPLALAPWEMRFQILHRLPEVARQRMWSRYLAAAYSRTTGNGGTADALTQATTGAERPRPFALVARGGDSSDVPEHLSDVVTPICIASTVPVDFGSSLMDKWVSNLPNDGTSVSATAVALIPAHSDDPVKGTPAKMELFVGYSDGCVAVFSVPSLTLERAGTNVLHKGNQGPWDNAVFPKSLLTLGLPQSSLSSVGIAQQAADKAAAQTSVTPATLAAVGGGPHEELELLRWYRGASSTSPLYWLQSSKESSVPTPHCSPVTHITRHTEGGKQYIITASRSDRKIAKWVYDMAEGPTLVEQLGRPDSLPADQRLAQERREGTPLHFIARTLSTAFSTKDLIRDRLPDRVSTVYDGSQVRTPQLTGDAVTLQTRNGMADGDSCVYNGKETRQCVLSMTFSSACATQGDVPDPLCSAAVGSTCIACSVSSNGVDVERNSSAAGEVELQPLVISVGFRSGHVGVFALIGTP